MHKNLSIDLKSPTSIKRLNLINLPVTTNTTTYTHNNIMINSSAYYNN